jgi:tetratricopeptide (TPR) repeat protein
MLADAAAQQRDEAALRHYAPLAEEAARRYDHKLYQAITHRAWGVAHRLAGEHAEAEARLSQALELFRGLDTRWQIGRTLFELSELAATRGEAAMAREQLSLALAAFEEMKAAPDAARPRAILETLK